MSSCEKCWADSRWADRFWDGKGETPYHKLLRERTGEDECTPEQQAGPEAGECPKCHRQCLHQHTGECMNGDCDAGEALDTDHTEAVSERDPMTERFGSHV